jgi:hypothetical protein
MCGRYASFLPAEAFARIFGTKPVAEPCRECSKLLRGLYGMFTPDLVVERASSDEQSSVPHRSG